MISYFKSLSILFNYTNKFFFYYFKNRLPITFACNNISFYNLYSFKNIPHYNNSAMDGYAILSSKIFFDKNAKYKSFDVFDIVKAGDNFNFKTLDGDFVIEIMTGAKIPEGFDSVIKFEDVFFVDNNKKKIFINNFIKKGLNIRKIGEDYKFNDLIIEKGDILSNSDILSLSSFGFNFVETFVKPKIYLLSTGNEIIDFFEKKNLYFYNNFNSSAFYIFYFFKSLGFDVNYLGRVNDKIYKFINKLNEILNSNENLIFITTGAVSKGIFDFIPNSLQKLDFDLLFHGVKIKPGKPILFGKHKFKFNSYFFGLPGNPISSLIGVRFFVYPFLRYLLGLHFEKPIKAYLINRCIYFNKKYDLFLKSYCFIKKSKLYVKILKNQESFKISEMLNSNCFVFLSKNTIFKYNSLVFIYLINPKLE